ncbi:MAG: MCE family protein [Methylococcales bacterium]|nr:MCE family protein [Methylococcales bacterium]
MNTDSSTRSRHYIHQMTYNYRERLVGFFVFFGFLLFLLFILISVKNQHLFEKRVKFYIDVKSSEGIHQGSIVTVLGTEVGRVTSLSLAKDNKIRVAIEVYEGQQPLIKTDARAFVNRLTNLGNALVEIKPGLVDTPMLMDGAIIPVDETPSLNDLLLSIANIIQSADGNELLTKFETILPKLEFTLENVHEIITQIASGHGVLGAAIFDHKVENELKTVVTSGAEILSEAEGIINIAKKRLVQLEPILNDANQVSHDLPAMVGELSKIIAQVNTAVALINGELNNISGTTNEVRRAITKADHLLESVQTTWPLSNDIKKQTSSPLIPVHPGHD